MYAYKRVGGSKMGLKCAYVKFEWYLRRDMFTKRMEKVNKAM